MNRTRADWRLFARCGLWAGLFWGTLEGVALVASRGFPAIQAAHKVPPEALWIAPAVQVILFLLAAGPVALAAGWAQARVGPAMCLSLYSLLGAAALFAGQGLLHWSAVVMLSAAAATMVFRGLSGDREARLSSLLNRGWLPVGALALLALGTTIAIRVIEQRRDRAVLQAADAAAPDIVVLILDTVRRDRLHRASGSLMPALERRMEQGAVFTNAWATSSWSLPAQATVLTGRIPQAHGADWPDFKLADSVPTLPEYFRSRGYATGAFSSNDSWITPEYLARGFGRFHVYRTRDVWRRTAGGRLVGRGLKVFGWRGDSPSKPMRTTTDEFLSFAAEHGDRPIFAYLCYMDANRAYYDQRMSHPSWTPRPPLEEGISAYEREIARLDAELDRLWAGLERRGRLQNSIVVVASDHGESFGEESGDHDPRGHGTSLYPEQVRIPLMVLAPGRIPTGTRPGHAVSLTELAGFVTRLAGIPDAPFPSRDLLTAPDSGTAGWQFLTLDYSRFSERSLVAEQLQYIWRRSTPESPEELYDLAEDPGARRNLSGGHPLLPALRTAVRRVDPAAEADPQP